ncbi:MAG: polysaccharide deacetylase family protein [Gemmatimonadota bacterium]
MKLLVSIHDVTPAHDECVRELWAICAERRIEPALLVVPNWHGQWPLGGSLSFLTWIRQRADAGAEVFLHGERHDEFECHRSVRDSLRAFGRTDAEGEFLALSCDESYERISRGAATLRACGLEPIGFVPPAWLGHRGLPAVVASAGLRFSEDESNVHLHERAMFIEAPVTRWSARTHLRAKASSMVAALRWYAERASPCVRVALHPQDLVSTDVRHSIEATLDRWLTAHYPWTYASL